MSRLILIDICVHAIFVAYFSISRSECSALGGANGGSCADGFGVCCISKNYWMIFLTRIKEMYITYFFKNVWFYIKLSFFLFRNNYSWRRLSSQRIIYCCWSGLSYCRISIYLFCLSFRPWNLPNSFWFYSKKNCIFFNSQLFNYFHKLIILKCILS